MSSPSQSPSPSSSPECKPRPDKKHTSAHHEHGRSMSPSTCNHHHRDKQQRSPSPSSPLTHESHKCQWSHSRRCGLPELASGVLTPIFHSYATRALAMPVGHMVSISLWCHFIATQTSSRLVRASKITLLACWITLPLHLGSGGATRRMNMPIVSAKRTTPCK